MASKQNQNKKNRFASVFKVSGCKSDSKGSKREPSKHKVSKLFSRIGQFFRKTEVNEPSSVSFPMSPNTEMLFADTHELSSRIPMSFPELENSSTEVTEEFPSETDEFCLDMEDLSVDLSSDITKLPRRGCELSLKSEELCFNKRRNVQPEIFIFPPDSSILSFEGEERRGISQPRRINSDTQARSAIHIEQQRKHIVSEPCINKYAQTISARGIQLSEAAYELSEEQCRSLYEDIFQPLDVFAILKERSKSAS